jgi:hypothetical protein
MNKNRQPGGPTNASGGNVGAAGVGTSGSAPTNPNWHYYAPNKQPGGPTNAGAGSVGNAGGGNSYFPPGGGYTPYMGPAPYAAPYAAPAAYGPPAPYAGQTSGGYATLMGRVTRGGRPVPYATVRVANLSRFVTAGPDGRYTLNQLSPSVVNLQASAHGSPTAFKNYTLGPSQVYTVNFELAGAGSASH